MTKHLSELTAAQFKSEQSKAAATSFSYTQSCLDRIAEREPQVGAWSHVDPDGALAQAKAADAATTGMLRGVPIGVRDVILTRGLPTESNSPIYRGFNPDIDAACVRILRDAGAVILGKTTTVELASLGAPPLTRNPAALEHTPGGSSSGSAAAVADGHVPIALGTQTGGSIIRPASYCGVWGFKPTWNFASTEGIKRFATSLDTLGWFARSAEDLALIYDLFDPDVQKQQAPPLNLAGARIALCRSPVWDAAEPETCAAMTLAETRLRKMGASVEILDLPPLFDALPKAQRVIMFSEARSGFLAEHRIAAELLHPSIRALVENAEDYSLDDLRRAHDLAAQGRMAFDELASGYDGVITPSTPGPAPKGLAQTGAMTFNAMWTLLHTPCVNVPLPVADGALPIGLTVTGPRFADRRVLAAAQAVGAAFSGQPID